MKKEVVIIILIVSVIAFCIIYFIGIYNKLLHAFNKVKDKFTTIDNLIKNKIDTLPKLIEIIKKYNPEEEIINDAIKVRNTYFNINHINDKIIILDNLNIVIDKLTSLTESYLELKKDNDFIGIQIDLENIDNNISYAKSFYNDTVKNYNNLRDKFLFNIIASIFKLDKFNFMK